VGRNEEQSLKCMAQMPATKMRRDKLKPILLESRLIVALMCHDPRKKIPFDYLEFENDEPCS